MVTKVAILGGGMSALAAAYEITRRSEPGEYEITIYQMGWRLGGKLATGRNYKVHDRIEEHGIHVLFGSYENVFYVLRRALADLGIDDWQSLFEQRSQFTAMERAGSWRAWDLDFPPGRSPGAPDGPCYPGDALFAGNDAKAVPELIPEAIKWIDRRITQHLSRHGPLGRMLARWITGHLDRGLSASSHTLAEDSFASALRILRRYHVSHWWASHLLAWWPWVNEARDGLRRRWIELELALVGAVGLRRAAHEGKSFDDLDYQDFRTWLDANAIGAASISRTTRDSAALRMIYELIFAYRDGDVKQPSLAAGTALRAVLRLFMDYRGSFVWAMRRGSETVVTPLYKVLHRQGVKFEFFHRVDELVAGAGNIEQVRMSVQARPKTSYAPLYKDESWPATPFYEQLEPGLEDGDEFKSPLSGKNPEYDASRARPVANKVIEFRRDFDKLVLALPPEELKLRAKFADDPQWQAMLDGLTTTATAAVQLWMSRDAQALGWRNAVPATVGTYAHGLPDWIDLTPTIAFEDWPRGNAPASVAYFVGTVPEPTGDRDIRRETEQVETLARQWLGQHAYRLWPNAGRRGDFDWRVLHDAANGSGEARLSSQYFRMNLDRSERYTLSLPGTMGSRLGAHDSRYDNLFLCGDWTNNGLNVGAVEAAVMSGRQAARAILGQDFIVYGESLKP